VECLSRHIALGISQCITVESIAEWQLESKSSDIG
jgi:hypothetical protein